MQPRQMVSTTPRPTPLIKQLLGDPNCALTRAETKANAANLADGFIDHIEARYGGTNMGRQELEGALVDDVPGALWTHQLIEQCRVKTTPEALQIISESKCFPKARSTANRESKCFSQGPKPSE